MDTYYQLIDKDTSTITVWWKVIHIFCFTIGIVSGFATAHFIGRSIEQFGDNCILFANIAFGNHANDSHKRPLLHGLREIPDNLLPINVVTSDWGTDRTCYLCQYTPLMCMIAAVICCAFFLLSAKGGAGYISDMIYGSWRIIYPALAFAAIAAVSMLISTLKLHEGIDIFCANFEKVFHTKSCTPAIDDYTLSFHEEKKHLIAFLKTAICCSYICFAAWVFQLCILILRIICIVDFELIKITVVLVDKEKEQYVTEADESFDSLTTIVETESIDTPKKHRLSFFRKKKGSVSRKPILHSSQTTATTPKQKKKLKFHDNQDVTYIDESPTTENTDATETTSFTSDQHRQKPDSPDEEKKSKRDTTSLYLK